jgi:hypothetical protein
MARRPGGKDSAHRADRLLGRFPVTDLARALALRGERRRGFLSDFVEKFPKGSYGPVRSVVPRIYGSQPPLMDLPVEEWKDIECSLRRACPPDILDDNIEVGQLLYEHAKAENYRATDHYIHTFLYGPGSATIGINCYLTKDETIIFQYPQFRRDALNVEQVRCLLSIVHHAYAIGDFAMAEMEIVQFPARKGKKREVRLERLDRAQVLDRPALNAEIDDVYAILRDLAGAPKT